MTYMHSYSLICVYIDLISFDMKLSVVYYFAFVTVGSTLRNFLPKKNVKKWLFSSNKIVLLDIKAHHNQCRDCEVNIPVYWSKTAAFHL